MGFGREGSKEHQQMHLKRSEEASIHAAAACGEDGVGLGDHSNVMRRGRWEGRPIASSAAAGEGAMVVVEESSRLPWYLMSDVVDVVLMRMVHGMDLAKCCGVNRMWNLHASGVSMCGCLCLCL